MICRRSQAIESLLRDALKLIRSGDYSTPTLARMLGLSQPSVSRRVTALRERGYAIRSIKDDNSWSYEPVS